MKNQIIKPAPIVILTNSMTPYFRISNMNFTQDENEPPAFPKHLFFDEDITLVKDTVRFIESFGGVPLYLTGSVVTNYLLHGRKEYSDIDLVAVVDGISKILVPSLEAESFRAAQKRSLYFPTNPEISDLGNLGGYVGAAQTTGRYRINPTKKGMAIDLSFITQQEFEKARAK